MSLLYPITRRKWLKNKEKGLENYVADEVTKAVLRINKQLTFVNRNQNTFLTDSDVVNVSVKRNVYRNAVLIRAIFVSLFIALILAESAINYENMEIFIMPGENGLRALLMRIVTAFILTAGSIVAVHLIFETIFHNWLEQDKIKYNFPDTFNISVNEQLEKKDFNRFAFLVIYEFAEKRTAVIEAISSNPTSNNPAEISPLTLVSLILPFIGGMIMFVIKRNHNIIVAYQSMTRYKIKQDIDSKKKTYLKDVFSIKRAKTLNQEISISFKRIIRLKNYLEARNYRSKSGSNDQVIYNTIGIHHIEDQNTLKKYIIARLEPETLRYNNEINF
jgi:hypothetical protein